MVSPFICSSAMDSVIDKKRLRPSKEKVTSPTEPVTKRIIHPQ